MKELIEEINATNERLEVTSALRKKLHQSLKNVPNAELRSVYQQVVRSLMQRQIIPNQGEFIRTGSERLFERLWREETGMKLYPSLVIGRSPVDFFTPSIKKGIVFEVDGGIHNSELKGIKDNRHEEQLKGLGIAVSRVSNDQSKAPRTRKTLHGLRLLRLTDTRTRRRIFRRIYIETIGTWLPKERIYQLFPQVKGGEV